jgi:hypothetical protein
MCQRRCLELFNDYDYPINYHLSKSNVVVDALSRKTMAGGISTFLTTLKELLLDLAEQV